MDGHNDDDPWNETPRCMYCGHQLSYTGEVAEISIGEFVMGKKSGLHYFSPWEMFPDGEKVKLIHSHCLHTLMDFTEVKEGGLFLCNLCAGDLTSEPEVYRIRLGRLRDTGDVDFWEFVPSRDDQYTIFLCTDCMLEGLGEGDHTTGCVILGMA